MRTTSMMAQLLLSRLTTGRNRHKIRIVSDTVRVWKTESWLLMSPDEEFVRARHPQADLVEVNHPAPGQSKWCVHYHAELDSKLMGQGDTVEEAWASARANCAGDPIIA